MFNTLVSHKNHYRYGWAMGLAGVGGVLAAAASTAAVSRVGVLPKFARDHHADWPCLGMARAMIEKVKGRKKARKFWFWR